MRYFSLLALSLISIASAAEIPQGSDDGKVIEVAPAQKESKVALISPLTIVRNSDDDKDHYKLTLAPNSVSASHVHDDLNGHFEEFVQNYDSDGIDTKIVENIAKKYEFNIEDLPLMIEDIKPEASEAKV